MIRSSTSVFYGPASRDISQTPDSGNGRAEGKQLTPVGFNRSLATNNYPPLTSSVHPCEASIYDTSPTLSLSLVPPLLQFLTITIHSSCPHLDSFSLIAFSAGGEQWPKMDRT